MEIINKLTFDMAAAGMPPYIDAVQGDTLTRKVEVTLMTRGQVFDPSDGFVSVSVAFKKPDGTAGWYDTLPDGNIAATVISDGVYQVSLSPEMFTVHGSVYALFRFDLDGKTISTFPFVVRVSENPSFNSSKSENYYNVQTWDAVNASFDEIFDRLAKLEQGGGGETPDFSQGLNMNGGAIYSASEINLIQPDSGEGVFISAEAPTQDAYGSYVVVNFIGTLGDDPAVLRGLRGGLEDNDVATVGQLNAALGDIDSALDGIIAIQNELIGGGA